MATTEMNDVQPVQSQVLLFGDLSLAHVEESLKRLLHVKTNPLLAAFFQRVNHQLRRLLDGLPLEQQDFFPRFTTLIDLVSRLGETSGTPVLAFFLLSVQQVAQSIVYFSHGSRIFPPSSACIIGPCTGGFAAAALASSQNLVDLVNNGAEASILAFRTALVSFLISRSLSNSPQTEGSTSWSVAVSSRGEQTVEDLAQEYMAAKTPLRHSSLWKSAVTASLTITLSGQPSILQGFLETYSEQLRYKYLDIDSPYHAAHLFSETDVEQIVSHLAGSDTADQKPRLPVLSSATGQLISASTFHGLLHTVVQETLLKPVCWDLILDSCQSWLTQGGAQECTILPFSSNAGTMIASALTKEKEIEVTVADATGSGLLDEKPTGRFEHSKIAIVGYSGRFPSAASNDAFWELLRSGQDVHREVPRDRFEWEKYYDPTGKKKNTSRVKYGCWIDEPGVFDTRFFNMSPKEAENTDPAQRLAITTTYEAMEMAGMVRNRTASTQQDRIGVFFGTTSDDWREVNSGQDVGTYFIPGGNRAFVPGRISYFFRFSGPSLSIDTACSSSFAAIQAACSYLWRGECDAAIAGGTNVLTSPDNFAGLDRAHFLSTTGNCNAFDDEASGYCRSDAVGSVVLKRLEDAEADNDPIFGVILGTNTNHCGQTESITRPHEGDQISVFKNIIRHSGIDPTDVSYIEMHGTGTQAGDATEMNSVLSAFVPKYKRTEMSPQRPLFIGSAKANIGHAESASGVSSLIKVMEMMKHNEIPPHCGIKNRINHNYPLDLAQRGVNIAFEVKPWLRENSNGGKRRVFLNNFSAAGGNTAMLIEDAPLPKSIAHLTDPRSTHLVSVSAKSPKSLLANIKSILASLDMRATPPSVAALSYTTTARRTQHNYRVIVSGSDLDSVKSSLRSWTQENESTISDFKPIPSSAKKQARVAFAFTGQGTLYTAIGAQLFAVNETFKINIHKLNRLAEIQGFPSFIGLIDGTITAEELPNVSPVVTQLALVCVQVALYELWSSWGLNPAAVIGHSLGEYPALYAAGVLSSADMIYLVATRATLLEKLCTRGTHSMLAVKASEDVAEKLIRDATASPECEIACANQPAGHVIAGPVGKIDEVAQKAAESGVEVVKLNVPYAFHSPQVEPILVDFLESASQGVTYNAPTIPVLSPFHGRVVAAGETGVLNAEYLVAACRGQVNFKQALSSAGELTDADRTLWLEIGAHPACGGMVKGTIDSRVKTIASLRQNVDAYQTLTTGLKTLYLAGIDINWNEYHRHFPASHQMVKLPMYAWDLKNYWIQYKNDFLLYKGGDFPQQIAAAPTPVPVVRKYLSPCAQQIVEEFHDSQQSTMVVESDIFDPKLLPVLQGHLVNGAALCPSSMYADLAYTVADYLIRHCPTQIPDTTGLDVTNVKVSNPLIAKGNETTHLFRASVKADWPANRVSIDLFSVGANGKRTASHAKLDVVLYPGQQWLKEWKRNAHFITSRIKGLNAAIHSSSTETHLIKRGMAYKLFASLVDYKKEYQGMSEIVIDSHELEAVSTVQFQVGKEEFFLNPRWIDSLGGVAGFIMNANDGVCSKDQVFINHGWERMRIAEPFDEKKTYHAYNRMQLVENTTYAGDTYIMDGDRVIAIFEGVVFQGVPRRALDHLLPNAAAKSAAATKAPAKAPVAAVAPPRTPTKAAPQSRQAAPKQKRSPVSDVFNRILGLISEEVGVSLSDLVGDADFASLGVDSLLSLTITAKIRDEMGLDFPSSLFVDEPTVADLRTLLSNSDEDDTPSGDSSTYEDSESQITSPASSVGPETPGGGEFGSSESARVALVVRQAICEETQVAMEELKSFTCLSDIGVDSLLGLTLSSRLQDLLQVDIPGNMLMDFETVHDLEEEIYNVMGLEKPQKKASGPTQVPLAVPQPLAVPAVTSISSLPQATSILLSGSIKTAQTILFLFPDGSGSASSYAHVARAVAPSTFAVYGLNCPWRKTARDMTRLGITMSSMVAQYLPEVQRMIQKVRSEGNSTATIALGGWSAGGILAFEAIRQMGASTPISHLVLFDSPNPIGLQNPPQRMFDFFDGLGIFGPPPGKNGEKAKTPEWLLDHFNAFISILDDYEPSPLPNAPASLMIYAKDGVCKDPNGPQMDIRPDDPREMIWLLNNRTDFTADGWASIIGREKLSITVLDEVNHFSLMDPGPKMPEMGEAVAEFLGRN
uniref:Non-reducing polyketide synthase phnA n=1 Tax=Penicillium herquei TaxID=69774 RepID=PHNA_PENHR|nr:RecName: Full=Non-reducing polyketide synthase phnA; Short=NR-PKS phnA; AltName: Full=Phenalenone biosynthesis cluster protein A [Penicillium herquei]AMP46751.1 PhnA [Penicillium herquei]